MGKSTSQDICDAQQRSSDVEEEKNEKGELVRVVSASYVSTVASVYWGRLSLQRPPPPPLFSPLPGFDVALSRYTSLLTCPAGPASASPLLAGEVAVRLSQALAASLSLRLRGAGEAKLLLQQQQLQSRPPEGRTGEAGMLRGRTREPEGEDAVQMLVDAAHALAAAVPGPKMGVLASCTDARQLEEAVTSFLALRDGFAKMADLDQEQQRPQAVLEAAEHACDRAAKAGAARLAGLRDRL